MTEKLSKSIIKVNHGMHGGAPCLPGKRITCANVVLSTIGGNSIVGFYEGVVTIEEVLAAIEYCASEQCIKDSPKAFCYSCSKDNIEEPIDQDLPNVWELAKEILSSKEYDVLQAREMANILHNVEGKVIKISNIYFFSGWKETFGSEKELEMQVLASHHIHKNNGYWVCKLNSIQPGAEVPECLHIKNRYANKTLFDTLSCNVAIIAVLPGQPKEILFHGTVNRLITGAQKH